MVWPARTRRPRSASNRSRAAWTILAAVIGCAVAGQLATADPGYLRLGYFGYLGAAQVIELDLDLELTPDRRLPERYRMTVGIYTSGSFGTLVPFRMDAEASGSTGQSGVWPSRYRSATRVLGRLESVTLTYRPGGAVDIATDPPTVEAREARARELAFHTLDPLSATVAIVNSAIRDGACSGNVPVFDGTRRYDLALASAGRSFVNKISFSLYEGEASECAVSAELLHGFHQPDVDAGLYPETATVWLAPVVADAPAVPVRIAGRSNLGAFRVDLVEAMAMPGPMP